MYIVSEKDNTNIFPNKTFLLLVRLLWFWCMLKLWCMHMLLGMVYSPYSLLESDTWTWTSELSIFECVLLRNHTPNILISLPTKWKHASMASVFHENCHTTLLRDSPKSSFGGVTLARQLSEAIDVWYKEWLVLSGNATWIAYQLLSGTQPHHNPLIPSCIYIYIYIYICIYRYIYTYNDKDNNNNNNNSDN